MGTSSVMEEGREEEEEEEEDLQNTIDEVIRDANDDLERAAQDERAVVEVTEESGPIELTAMRLVGDAAYSLFVQPIAALFAILFGLGR